MTDWLTHFDEWSRLVREEREIRATRRSLDELSACCQAQQRAIARAATQMPVGGRVGTWLEHALLEADVESAENTFAVIVLAHRKLFPRRYLRAYVRAAMRDGGHRTAERILTVASSAFGGEAVLRELLDVARDGLLGHERMRFLLHYVRDAKWSKQPVRRGVEYDLVKELIRITSGGTVTWHRERPKDD